MARNIYDALFKNRPRLAPPRPVRIPQARGGYSADEFKAIMNNQLLTDFDTRPPLPPLRVNIPAPMNYDSDVGKVSAPRGFVGPPPLPGGRGTPNPGPNLNTPVPMPKRKPEDVHQVDVKSLEQTNAEIEAATTPPQRNEQQVIDATINSEDPKKRKEARDKVKQLREEGNTKEDVMEYMGELADYWMLQEVKPGEDMWDRLATATAQMRMQRRLDKKEAAKQKAEDDKAAAALEEQRKYESAEWQRRKDAEMEDKKELATIKHGNDKEIANLKGQADVAKALAKAKVDARKDALEAAGKKSERNDKVMDKLRQENDKLSAPVRVYGENLNSANIARDELNKAREIMDKVAAGADPEEIGGAGALQTSAVIKTVRAILGPGVLSDADVSRVGSYNSIFGWAGQMFRKHIGGKADSYTRLDMNTLENLLDEVTAQNLDKKIQAGISAGKAAERRAGKEYIPQLENAWLTYHDDPERNFNREGNIKKYFEKNGLKTEGEMISYGGHMIPVFSSKEAAQAANLPKWKKVWILE